MGRARYGHVANRPKTKFLHQVALPEVQTNGVSYFAIREFTANLSVSNRTHMVVYEGIRYMVFCFSEKEDADKFMNRFCGEPFDPRDKGRGDKWMHWYKGRAVQQKRSPYDFEP